MIDGNDSLENCIEKIKLIQEDMLKDNLLGFVQKAM